MKLRVNVSMIKLMVEIVINLIYINNPLSNSDRVCILFSKFIYLFV